jgi:hypothetical protein
MEGAQKKLINSKPFLSCIVNWYSKENIDIVVQMTVVTANGLVKIFYQKSIYFYQKATYSFVYLLILLHLF